MEHTTVNGRYRIDTRIGDGGMAEVYLGHDLLLNRPVAIKMLREQFARDTSVRTRFEREAQAAANFSHPHIVEVYDVGEHDATPYIVMEYVRGETLKQVIDEEGPFDPDDVSALLEQVGAALDYAHARGVVHRDVKPQNILVDGDGLAKVADFGIAKAIEDSSLTETGTGIGTVHYLSPEQANGLMATPSSDVYSLGVVAFEMLTQALPFDAESPVAVAVAHTRDEPPRPSEFEPTITGAVDAIVLRALAKDPTRRYRSAGEFAGAMSDWKEYRPPARSRAGSSDGRLHDDGVRHRTPHPLDAAATVALPTEAARNAAVPAPAGSDHWASPPAGAPPRPGFSQPLAPAAVLAGDGGRSGIGCGTWLTGGIVLALLVGLIVVGAIFSDGDGFSRPDFAVPNVSLPFGLGLGDDGDGQANALATPSAAPAASVAGSAPAGAAPPTSTPISQVVAVPDVVGMTVEDARAALGGQGLSITVAGETRYSDAVPVDGVAQQDPPAGADARRGDIVAVIRSRGPAPVDVDRLAVIGLPADQATTVLQGAGLVVDSQPVASVDVAAGQVARVDPAGQVAPGSRVTIFISQGDTILIPVSISGMPLDQARTTLTEAGFVIVGEDTADRARIEAAGVDLAAAGIEDGDVVGVQNADGTAGFGAWLPPGTELTLVSYDASRDAGARTDGDATIRSAPAGTAAGRSPRRARLI